MSHQNIRSDPPSQGPVLAISAAPAPVTIKEEPGQVQHLPPAGSVDNPMEIDDSGDDEAVVHNSVVTPKRRMKGVCIAGDLLAFLKFLITVPPPSGESPGKRLKPASDHPSGSKDLTPAATSKKLPISDEAVESSKQLV